MKLVCMICGIPFNSEDFRIDPDGYILWHNVLDSESCGVAGYCVCGHLDNFNILEFLSNGNILFRKEEHDVLFRNCRHGYTSDQCIPIYGSSN
jgi:hypothetical protein